MAYILIVGTILFSADGSDGNDANYEHCMDWHRMNGRYQVLYPDGKLSQPFSRRVAEDWHQLT